MHKTSVCLLFLFVFIAGCAAPQVVQDWDFPIKTRIELNGLKRERLFDLSRLWLVRHLYSEKSIIDYENKAEGIIIANGTVDYPATGLEAIERVQYTISFRLTETIDETGIACSFDSLLINVPKVYDLRPRLWQVREYYGGYSRPLDSMNEYRAARKVASGIVDRLRDYLAAEAR